MAGLSPAVAFWRGVVFRKIVTGIIVVPLAIIIVAFAVANRQMVTVSFDPFSSASPAYAATLPLFVLIFILLIVGVIVGGVAAWIGQAKWRRGDRRARRRGAQAPERGRHHRDAHDDDAAAAAAGPAARHPAAGPLTRGYALRRRGEGARTRPLWH